MHLIEPYYRWKKLYNPLEDVRSPFYGVESNEFEFHNKIYNYLIHPQWDNFGSETLYLKVLFVDYNIKFTIIEFIGEWNDTLYNDVMHLKRNVIDDLINEGIDKFILIGENVLNFHSSDDSYYEEWFDQIEDGWIMAINFQDHVIREFEQANIDYFLIFQKEFDNFNWRKYTPIKLYEIVNNSILKRLGI